MEVRQELEIGLSTLRVGLTLSIIQRKDNSLFFNESAHQNCESPYQLVEGYFYEYQFSNSSYYFCKDKIVTPNRKSKHIGVIAPNTHVGTLCIPVYYEGSEVGKIELEVQAIKADYRSDYREMLAQVSEICTELIMQVNSPASHYFESDLTYESKSIFQRFEFLKSIIDNEVIYLALQKILASPVTKWTEVEDDVDIRKVKKLTNSNIKEMITNHQRVAANDLEYLEAYGIYSIPRRIKVTQKIDSYDTPENRFIKYILEEYLSFCIDVSVMAEKNSKIYRESLMIIEQLEGYVANDFFKSIAKPTMLSINSPALQRKEGYREIFKYWLIFNTSSRLTWEGGEDIYGAGKKNVALLYEYWIFFKVTDILQRLFSVNKESLTNLIKLTASGFNLQLKQGSNSSVTGYYPKDNKLLKFKFSYNRVFDGSTPNHLGGSWSIPMKPDYTLSLWPYNLKEAEAEKQELIMHIHFDAKYKIADLEELLNSRVENDNETAEEEQELGKVKNVDLLKMHAYKDSIRRTFGAYILYPGKKTMILKEFEATSSGIGAFPMNPSGKDIEMNNIEMLLVEAVSYFVEEKLKVNKRLTS